MMCFCQVRPWSPEACLPLFLGDPRWLHGAMCMATGSAVCVFRISQHMLLPMAAQTWEPHASQADDSDLKAVQQRWMEATGFLCSVLNEMRRSLEQDWEVNA